MTVTSDTAMDVQNRARLIYIPAGYMSAYAAIKDYDKGVTTFTDDEIALIREADEEMLNSLKNEPAANAIGERTPRFAPVDVKKVWHKDIAPMMRRPLNLSACIDQAKEVCRSYEYESIAAARDEKGKRLSAREMSDISDAYWALSDNVDLHTEPSVYKLGDVYLANSRKIVKELGLNSLKQLIEQLVEAEPLLTAKQITQVKIAWQWVKEEREKRKPNKTTAVTTTTTPANTQTSVSRYTGGTTSTNGYWDEKAGKWIPSTKPYNRPVYEDYEDDYGWGGGYNVRSYSYKRQAPAEWGDVISQYHVARQAGDEVVFIGQKDPVTAEITDIIQGDIPLTAHVVDEGEDALGTCELAISNLIDGLTESFSDLQTIATAFGMEIPDDCMGEISTVVDEMMPAGEGKKAERSLAQMLVLAQRELEGALYHVANIEEMITQEAEYRNNQTSAVTVIYPENLDTTSGVILSDTEDAPTSTATDDEQEDDDPVFRYGDHVWRPSNPLSLTDWLKAMQKGRE